MFYAYAVMCYTTFLSYQSLNSDSNTKVHFQFFDFNSTNKGVFNVSGLNTLREHFLFPGHNPVAYAHPT